jgi:hypothetical protein
MAVFAFVLILEITSRAGRLRLVVAREGYGRGDEKREESVLEEHLEVFEVGLKVRSND